MNRQMIRRVLTRYINKHTHNYFHQPGNHPRAHLDGSSLNMHPFVLPMKTQQRGKSDVPQQEPAPAPGPEPFQFIPNKGSSSSSSQESSNEDMKEQTDQWAQSKLHNYHVGIHNLDHYKDTINQSFQSSDPNAFRQSLVDFFSLVDSTNALQYVAEYHKFIIMFGTHSGSSSEQEYTTPEKDNHARTIEEAEKVIKRDVESIKVMMNDTVSQIQQFYLNHSYDMYFPLHKAYIGASMAMQKLNKSDYALYYLNEAEKALEEVSLRDKQKNDQFTAQYKQKNKDKLTDQQKRELIEESKMLKDKLAENRGDKAVLNRMKGSVYLKMNRFADCVKHHSNAMSLYGKITSDNAYDVILSYREIAQCFSKNKTTQKEALENMEKAIYHCESMLGWNDTNYSLINHTTLEYINILMTNKQYTQARIQCEKLMVSLEFALLNQQINFYDIGPLVNCSIALSRALELADSQYKEQYDVLTRTIKIVKRVEAIEGVESKYEFLNHNTHIFKLQIESLSFRYNEYLRNSNIPLNQIEDEKKRDSILKSNLQNMNSILSTFERIYIKVYQPIYNNWAIINPRESLFESSKMLFYWGSSIIIDASLKYDDFSINHKNDKMDEKVKGNLLKLVEKGNTMLKNSGVQFQQIKRNDWISQINDNINQANQLRSKIESL